jgi:hypothetical protein
MRTWRSCDNTSRAYDIFTSEHDRRTYASCLCDKTKIGYAKDKMVVGALDV